MLLETTFLVDLQREWSRKQEGPAHRFLRDHRDVPFKISVVSYAEFLEGYEDPARGDAFLGGFAKVDVSEATAWRAARIRRDLRLSGNLIGDFDILIASTALEARLRLVTADREHFGRIPGLELHDYRS